MVDAHVASEQPSEVCRVPKPAGAPDQPMTPTEGGHRLLKLLDQPDVRHLLDQHPKQMPNR